MIDPVVERQYSDTKELMSHWNTFHQFFNLGVKGENITPEKENQFLDLKSRIAMLHDSFMDALTSNQNVGQDVLSVITRAITLKGVNRLSTADTKKLETEWHDVYLLLNDTIAVLEQKRQDLDAINESQFRAKRAAGLANQKVRKFLGSFYFKLSAIIVALLFVTIGIQTLGFYDYDNIGQMSGLTTPYNWGKAAVRIVKPDSPWPSIQSMYRKPHSGWPAGLSEPEVDTDLDKDGAARKLAQLTAPAGIGQQFGTILQSALEFKYEESTKQHGDGVEIYTFRFANADQSRELDKLWKDTRKGYANRPQNNRTPTPPVIDRLEMAPSVNIVTIVYSQNPETAVKMMEDVFGRPH